MFCPLSFFQNIDTNVSDFNLVLIYAVYILKRETNILLPVS